jgi:hypothetical protein
MKRVGILDNYISNYHSNTYSKFFKEIADEEGLEEYKITHVYAVLDKSPSTGETTSEWCERLGAVACSSPREVCDAVDVIMVLSPNHPELHEELCKVAFDSGKPVYVDKTFAPDYDTAKRIAAMGKAKGANFWSSSATRFEPEIIQYLNSDAPSAESVIISGGNVFEIYCIHLVELMNTFMKNGAASVVCRSNNANLVFEISYSDGRRAFLTQFVGTSASFACYPVIDGQCKQHQCKSDFWKSFTHALIDFFDTGVAPIPIENTVECIAIRDALKKAIEAPNTEIAVEK